METAPQPTNLRTTNILQWVPILKVVILCGGSIISFVIAYFNGSVSGYVPFLSETGASIPEMITLSLTLCFGAAAGAVGIVYRFLILRYQLPAMDNSLNKMNRLSTICGLISMIGLVGMAAVPMSAVLWVHLVFAFTHFFFALAYVKLQTKITYYIPGGNTTWNQIRDLCCLLLMIFMILLLIFFPVSLYKWSKANPLTPPALKTPNDPYFGLMLTTAVIEWSVYAAFLTVILSFHFEFRNFELIYGIVPRQNGAPATSLELTPIL